jgi:hypothetical protein
MPDETERDLTERIADAARLAVLNRRPSISHDQGVLRSVVVEIEVDRTGQVSAAESYVQHRVSMASILAGRS